MKTMVLQMIQCIHDLRYLAHILHGDISVNNILYILRDGEDHTFSLNDFNRAVGGAKACSDVRPSGGCAHYSLRRGAFTGQNIGSGSSCELGDSDLSINGINVGVRLRLQDHHESCSLFSNRRHRALFRLQKELLSASLLRKEL
ncbi:hypothetical protein BC629DRAFT_1449393 [Irpex lacteus]|nr:hypothetical protein BC629DRAFT_1449393 [Irpex lacteus]